MYHYGAISTAKFLRQLKVLNPKLRVCAFENSNKLAGLYYIDSTGEWFDICGVDKDFVPEYTEYDAQGHIIKSGWRRVYLMLVQLKLTTPSQINKVCPGFYLHAWQFQVDADRLVRMMGDPIQAKMVKMSESAPMRTWIDPDTGKKEEGTVLTLEQNLELAQDIQAKDPDNVKEEAAKERWFLETWQDRGGNISDKPKI